jgi:hypothetical protein
MTKPITVIAVLSLLAVPLAVADARTVKHHGKRYVRVPHYGPAYSRGTDYFEHDSNKLHVGTAEWWRQMQREDRVRR